jgi:hypothetical protein
VPRNRNAFLLGAAVIATLGTVATQAQAAPGIARDALDVGPLKRLSRVGLIIVGTEDRESVAARTFVATSLGAAGHPVVVLATSTSTPPRPWLLQQCAARDVDAVALVRISTEAPGWRVNVDIRDPEGRQLVLHSQQGESTDPYGGSGSLVPVYATFSFAMRPDDAAAQEPPRATTIPQTPETDADEDDDDAAAGRARLWVSENVTMFGPVRINDAEFYRLVGHPELGKRNSAGIAITRTLGFTALGAGLTGLVIGAFAAGFESGACEGPNIYDMFTARPATCGTSTGGLIVLPLAVAGIGAGLLIASAALRSDRPSLETRKALAHEYNARIAVSAAPSLKGDGGVMVINGRF